MSFPSPRSTPALVHLGVSVAVGVAVGLSLPHQTWEIPIPSGWSAFCLAFLVSIWPILLRASPEQTKALATREDAGRGVSAAIVTIGAVTSLAGVLFALDQASLIRQEHPVLASTLTGLGVLVVAASWGVLHTLYTLHYARRYYEDRQQGVSFNTSEAPSYQDFAYLAFTIGMTFQVSDTNLTTTRMRRLVWQHALLSYLFGTVIVAVTINGLAGLLGKSP
ncbi:MAG: DUF1345 domain-containing protein [Thermaceae bacterium]|nr:DUF1345 domain-containing protein [Thermaceae bacterium]